LGLCVMVLGAAGYNVSGDAPDKARFRSLKRSGPDQDRSLSKIEDFSDDDP
jgi:hypothetical protein